jgi:hypothetical protein
VGKASQNQTGETITGWVGPGENDPIPVDGTIKGANQCRKLGTQCRGSVCVSVESRFCPLRCCLRHGLSSSLAHWLQRQAKDYTKDGYQFELEANRITVAFWREKDGEYLSALLARFQRISDRLPSPVPDGQDAEQYFNANRSGLGANQDVYGWFPVLQESH